MRVVTKDIQARFELGEDQIAFWNGLSAAEQDAFHDQAVYEVRDAIAQENFHGKLGIRRAWQGRGVGGGRATRLRGQPGIQGPA